MSMLFSTLHSDLYLSAAPLRFSVLDTVEIFVTNLLLTQIITGFQLDTSFILTIMMQNFDILPEQDQHEACSHFSW